MNQVDSSVFTPSRHPHYHSHEQCLELHSRLCTSKSNHSCMYPCSQKYTRKWVLDRGKHWLTDTSKIISPGSSSRGSGTQRGCASPPTSFGFSSIVASRSCDDRDRPIAHCFSENVGSFFGTGFEGRLICTPRHCDFSSMAASHLLKRSNRITNATLDRGAAQLRGDTPPPKNGPHLLPCSCSIAC